MKTEVQKRLYSLDALRGFDMFWITGGGALVSWLAKRAGADWLDGQMEHVSWEGFHFFDLIFPLFMFISGVAIFLTVESKLANGVSKKALAKKAFFRMVMLILFGLLYNGTFRTGFEDGRVASVLAQIGIGYFFASLIVIYFKSLKTRLIWLAGILTGIGLIQLLIPVPGFGAGNITPDGSINAFIDQLFLPGRLIYKTHDPEGILCSISATGITLTGTFAGYILKLKEWSGWKKIGYMAIIGAGLIVLALLLSTFYPIVKKAWTSTFNILTGGIGFLLLAFFYMIIDHLGYKKWAFYFRVIGMNSIFVYLFTRIVDCRRIAEFFIGWLAKPLGEYSELLLLLGYLAVVWLVLYFMYRKNIFLRV